MSNIVLTSHELGIDLGNFEGQSAYADPDDYVECVLAELRGEALNDVHQRLSADYARWYEAVVFLQKQVQLRFTETKSAVHLARAEGLRIGGNRGKEEYFKKKAEIEKDRTKLQHTQSLILRRLVDLKVKKREEANAKKAKADVVRGSGLWDLIQRAVPYVDDVQWHKDLAEFRQRREQGDDND